MIYPQEGLSHVGTSLYVQSPLSPPHLTALGQVLPISLPDKFSHFTTKSWAIYGKLPVRQWPRKHAAGRTESTSNKIKYDMFAIVQNYSYVNTELLRRKYTYKASILLIMSVGLIRSLSKSEAIRAKTSPPIHSKIEDKRPKWTRIHWSRSSIGKHNI